MGAYNRTNGEPCCGSKFLLVDTVRGRWGFEGHIVSDCWAIRDFHEGHMVTETPAQSAALAMEMGCDLNCGDTYLHMRSAYEQGLVTEEDITACAERLFTSRYMLGIMEEEPTKFEKWLSEKLGKSAGDLAMTIAVVLAAALSVGLFVILPSLAVSFRITFLFRADLLLPLAVTVLPAL